MQGLFNTYWCFFPRVGETSNKILVHKCWNYLSTPGGLVLRYGRLLSLMIEPFNTRGYFPSNSELRSCFLDFIPSSSSWKFVPSVHFYLYHLIVIATQSRAELYSLKNGPLFQFQRNASEEPCPTFILAVPILCIPFVQLCIEPRSLLV